MIEFLFRLFFAFVGLLLVVAAVGEAAEDARLPPEKRAPIMGQPAAWLGAFGLNLFYFACWGFR